VFLDNGYTKEEMKMIDETKKILDDATLKVTATAVRVPIFNSHSESVNVELLKPFEIDAVKALLKASPGVVLQDDPANSVYPLAAEATGTDPVYVGRIRRDESLDNGINLWIVADNIRKGAATNTIQIAETLISMNLV
jgi:aspartate-semialdehyde dehydrogenase